MRDIGNYLKVIYSFSATIDKLRKTDITLDCGVTINTAAMSMMNVIDMNSEMTVTDLGQKMHLTKGAVSQMLTKLCKMGLTAKEQYDGNEKRVYPVLTERGKTVVDEYREKHQVFYTGVAELLDGYTEEDCNVIYQFLKGFDDLASEYADSIYEKKA